MVQSGTFFETKYSELITDCMHRYQDKIYDGRGSARVGLRHGDNHFWVI